MGTIDVDLLRVGKGTGIISHLPLRSGDDPERRGVAIDLLTEADCHGRRGGIKRKRHPASRAAKIRDTAFGRRPHSLLCRAPYAGINRIRVQGSFLNHDDSSGMSLEAVCFVSIMVMLVSVMSYPSAD